MRSRDVIQLYDIVGSGAKVTIVNNRSKRVFPAYRRSEAVPHRTQQLLPRAAQIR